MCPLISSIYVSLFLDALRFKRSVVLSCISVFWQNGQIHRCLLREDFVFCCRNDQYIRVCGVKRNSSLVWSRLWLESQFSKNCYFWEVRIDLYPQKSGLPHSYGVILSFFLVSLLMIPHFSGFPGPPECRMFVNTGILYLYCPQN